MTAVTDNQELTGQLMDRVVNLRAGSKYDVYIGRGSHGRRNMLGNPHAISYSVDRKEVIRRYAVDFPLRMRTEPDFAKAVEDARGKVLGCFCRPAECHGDVIIIYHLLGLEGVARVANGASVTTVLKSVEPNHE